MQGPELPEYHEGERAFEQGKKENQNPYPWTDDGRWRHEAWEKGHQQAQSDYFNQYDDYDD